MKVKWSSGGDPAVRAAPQRLGNEPRGEESSQAPNLFEATGGPRTSSTYFWTHLVEGGQSGAPAELGNEPHRQQTDAGSSAGRIADPYINLDFFFWKRKVSKVVLLLLK